MNDLTRDDEFVELQRRDLLDQLQKREGARERHTMWALIGISPGAAVPLLLSLSQFGGSALAAGVLLMTGREAWRAVCAKRDVAELRQALKELREG